ncbi:hypothetical protein SAMN06272735_2410 [Streptomyces sp. TLI_55]|uniref:hypothetical protein n=1 Tax=Streptomyces sp. TLI_55 TaxID=1938861 RepID=UPI000BD51E90|nr:hypothetical protein [Streptomyces sp. TLI_55]SNX57934.1 hypothetical protein SAMN06272735_2410 [Streptomyces sp. TLI_55]
MGVDIEDGIAAAVRLAEGASLREAFDTTDPAGWAALDAGARALTRVPGERVARSAWELTAGGQLLVKVLGRERRLLPRGVRLTASQLALGLCHRDGLVRQSALERVGEHPELIPLVVVRCADWVPQVHERARERLAELLDAEGAARLAPLLLRMGRRGRGGFAADLATALLSSAPREILAPLCRHTDRAVRRYAHRLVIAGGLLSPAELARAAALDDDTVVQDLCADAALAAVAQEGPDDDVLEPLLAARNPRARSAGVTALRRAGMPERAEAFLGDRAGRVRACARYVVRQYGGDPAAWYRERCAGAEVSPGIVSGLAECGERRDAAVLWALTSHPVAAVRARAVAGLRSLDVSDLARFTALLDDPDPGVVREATVALVPSARSLDEEWLLGRLAAGRSRAVRASAFRLLRQHSWLVRLRAADALIDDPDDKLRHAARHSLRH